MYPIFRKITFQAFSSEINYRVILKLLCIDTTVWCGHTSLALNNSLFAVVLFWTGEKVNCLEGELMSLCSKYCNKLGHWLLNMYKYVSMFPETEIQLTYKKILSNNTFLRRIRIRSFSGPYFPASGQNTERYSAMFCFRATD